MLLALFGLGRPASAAPDEKASCQEFVQDFYKWYLEKSNAPAAKLPAIDVALKTRGDVFSTELSKRLKEDLAASAKSPGEIVGLDFDPFLNSQSQEEHYKAQNVTTKGTSFFAAVYGVSNGNRSADPDVEPELTHTGGKWQFVNFHYTIDKKSDDLLHILKKLRDERQSHKK